MQDLPVMSASATDVPPRRAANVSFHDASSPMNCDAILRKGKWTTEEEDYANKIISLFNRGLLPIGAGTTLRSYLSDKLHCDPMRITKKFAGASCIGKQVFQPSESLLAERSEEIQELDVLETLFYHRVGDRSGGAHKNLPEDDADSSAGTSSKSFGAKWNREEGDTDISSAKHRAEFVGKSRDKANRSTSSGPGSVGMRSVVSAPDFGVLKQLHQSTEKTCDGRKRGFHTGVFNGKQRSQSVTDFMDFEHYISDDSAAGDLLMQFANKITEAQSDDENNSDQNINENIGPVTKFVSLSTIGKNSSSSSSSSKILKSSGRRIDSSSQLDKYVTEIDLKSSENAVKKEQLDLMKSEQSGSEVEIGSGINNSSESDVSKTVKKEKSECLEEKRLDGNEGEEEEDVGDDAPYMVDQSSDPTCSSPQSNIGHNYEDEDGYGFYDSTHPSQAPDAHALKNTNTNSSNINDPLVTLNLVDHSHRPETTISNVPCSRIRTVTEEECPLGNSKLNSKSSENLMVNSNMEIDLTKRIESFEGNEKLPQSSNILN